MIKKLKQLIPYKIRLTASLLRNGFFYDFIRYLKYSNSQNHFDSIEQLEAIITFNYHVIEKGLTMPETRLGFGTSKIQELVDYCNLFLSKSYNLQSTAFTHAVQTINEYLLFHKSVKYQLPEKLVHNIKSLSQKASINNHSNQLTFSKEEFFKMSDKSFKQFAYSRHTVRNYSSEDISLDTFKECIEIAQKSPSACNRQPNHAYIVKNKKLQEQILNIQSGNRGFGNLANTLIILTGDLSVFRFGEERNAVFFNSGMFAMTLIYALHYKKIGSCALNWDVNPSKDQVLRDLLDIPTSQTITLILSCGYLPQQVKIASSPRKEVDSILHIK